VPAVGLRIRPRDVGRVRVNLLEERARLRIGQEPISRDMVRAALQWTIPGASAALLLIGLTVAPALSVSQQLEAARERLTVLSAGLPPPTRQAQIQNAARALQATRERLDLARASVGDVLGPLVGLANALPSTTRLRRVSSAGGILTVSGDARSIQDLMMTQQTIVRDHYSMLITKTSEEESAVSWEGTVALLVGAR